MSRKLPLENLSKSDADKVVLVVNGYAYLRHGEAPAAAKTRMTGPGTRLHQIIAREIGVEPAKKCGCESMIAQMNKWGVEGCREHYEQIIAHLVEQTDQLPKAQRWFFKLPGTTRIAEHKARAMLDEALG